MVFDVCEPAETQDGRGEKKLKKGRRGRWKENLLQERRRGGGAKGYIDTTNPKRSVEIGVCCNGREEVGKSKT